MLLVGRTRAAAVESIWRVWGSSVFMMAFIRHPETDASERVVAHVPGRRRG